MKTSIVLTLLACFLWTPLTLVAQPALGGVGIIIDNDTDRVILKAKYDGATNNILGMPIVAYRAEFFIEKFADNGDRLWVKVGERFTSRPYFGTWEGNISVTPDAMFSNHLETSKLYLNCDDNDPNAECPYSPLWHAYTFRVSWEGKCQHGLLHSHWWPLGEDAEKLVIAVKEPGGEENDDGDWSGW